jgi:hypothetical protein
MGNPEHIATLKRGVSAWNKWRLSQLNQALIKAVLPTPDTMAYLNGADFGLRQLSGVQLFTTDLTDTSFSHAFLVSANFGTFTLYRGKDRRSITAAPARLTRTNLEGAILYEATFETCSLVDVDFSHALLGHTRFFNVSLAQAKGLESCEHAGPSYLDYRTLLKSGTLPTPFLRGCGFPDGIIEYLPSLLNQPIQFYSCFISYSSKDEEFAERLHADLQDKGIRCWYAPEDMRIGDKFRVRIEESIHLHDKLLVVLSENSIRSPWVEDEVEAGLERERREGAQVLFPIRLDDAVMKTDQAWAASLRRQRHIGDFSKWKDHDSYVKALDRLVRDLKPVASATSAAR